MSSNTSSIAYHNQIEIENNTLNNSQEDSNKSPYLSYANIQANSVSTSERVDTSPTAEAT